MSYVGYFPKNLAEKPTGITSKKSIEELERYVLDIYGFKQTVLGTASLDKFKKFADKDLRLLPPSRETLKSHAYLLAFQSGYLWRQCVKELDIPNPDQWVWVLNGTCVFYQPIWTSAHSSITVKNFTRTCSCKSGKCKTWKCVLDKISCISIFGCSRSCND